jgi:hypothetical protein
MSARRKRRRTLRHQMWLRLKYRLATALEAPFGDAFWYFHQRAVRLHDELAKREVVR